MTQRFSEASRVPVTLLGGFVGAGKTTLSNNVLMNWGSLRVVVIANDMCYLNIGADLVRNGASVRLPSP